MNNSLERGARCVVVTYHVTSLSKDKRFLFLIVIHIVMYASFNNIFSQLSATGLTHSKRLN